MTLDDDRTCVRDVSEVIASADRPSRVSSDKIDGMGSSRTMWHVLFADLLKEFAPPGFEVQTEVTLATEPQRADYVIIRREMTPGSRRRLRR